MKLQRVAVIGGGPAGLYAARLLKLSHPDASIAVYEHIPPEQTFGFGVGLSARTRDNLRKADADSFEAIVDACHVHAMEMTLGGRTARFEQDNLLAIGRTLLLQVLQQKAVEAGVELHSGQHREASELSADLIIAADGINSSTRNQYASQFRPHVTTGKGLYLWCGTEFALSRALFAPVTTEAGTFVTHAYPYAPDRSTFLIETDEQAWRNAGFDITTSEVAPDASDETALRYLETAFAEVLEGCPLVGNRTRWTRFRTISCDSWHAGNIVLLGDAAHTAHYSIGSGTKLAMEDAIVLDEALRGAADLDEALMRYEEARRPAVAHLQEVAHRSQLWWESFPQRMNLPVEQLMVNYFSRAGKVNVERFAVAAPDIARRGLASYGATEPGAVPDSGLPGWVLDRPLQAGDRHFATRVAPASLRDEPGTRVVDIDLPDGWNPEADRLVAEAPEAETFWLTGPSDREHVLTRLDIAERLCLGTHGIIVVEAPATCMADLVSGLASARTHLVAILEGSAADGGDGGRLEGVA